MTAAGEPKRYQLPIYSDAEDGLGDGWRAQDYTLAYALGVDDNYAAEAIVQRAAAEHEATRGRGYTFDSEGGCFFAYAKTREDIEALAVCVADLVAAGEHPNSIAGGLLDSPFAIRSWNPDHVHKDESE